MENYQKQSPFGDNNASPAQLKKWIDQINSATLLNEIVLLGEDITEETGFDILLDDDDDELESIENYDLLEAGDDKQLNPFGDDDKKSEENVDSDYGDDFEF